MNKFLAFFGFVAICVCLTDAATRGEVQRVIHQASQQARTQGVIAIKTASRDALIRATTQQQRICATSQIGLANQEVNRENNKQIVALENEVNSLTPEQLQGLDIGSFSQKVSEIFASVNSISNDWAQKIRQCA